MKAGQEKKKPAQLRQGKQQCHTRMMEWPSTKFVRENRFNPPFKKKHAPRTVLTQKVTSFKKEKKKTQRGTQASRFCYIRRKLFNCLSICFVLFSFLAKGVSSVRWKSWHSVSAWSRNGKCTSSQEHAFYLWCGNWKFLFTHFCIGKFNYKIILFLVINL